MIPEAVYHWEEIQKNRRYLVEDYVPENTNVPRLNVRIHDEYGDSRTFPVFQQNAMVYDDYSEYMKRHGCACCSLTTVLAAYRRHFRELKPQFTILVESDLFEGTGEWLANYSKPLARQMPISFYGISFVLRHHHIPHRYIGSFRDDEATEEIRKHLLLGRPVMIETSRIRRKNGWIVRINDKKYAGSYHTMVLLGIDMEGYVIFTDSATRSWAGRQQRLKRERLEVLIDYMYPQRNTGDDHVYFSSRRNTGGYILIDA